jgi:hypothetical protein
VAAPDYVPRPKDEQVRTYQSAPWRPEAWMADRPGEIEGEQPTGPGFGWQGPDQGYVLLLLRELADRWVLADGEHLADAEAGCASVAMKRASLFGRAPVVHDLTVAMAVWGFDRAVPDELVALRGPVFANIAHLHHSGGRRRVAELVPVEVLRLTPAEATAAAAADWRSVLDVAAAGAPSGH